MMVAFTVGINGTWPYHPWMQSPPLLSSLHWIAMDQNLQVSTPHHPTQCLYILAYRWVPRGTLAHGTPNGPWLVPGTCHGSCHRKCHSLFQSGLVAFVSRDLLVAFTTGVSGSYLTCWLLSTVKVRETVHVTPLRRTLASSLQSECASCLQCFDTVGWVAGRASGL